MESKDPSLKYCIGKDEKNPHDIGSFLRSHVDDPAIKVSCMFQPEVPSAESLSGFLVETEGPCPPTN
jgi:hypothetical protein